MPKGFKVESNREQADSMPSPPGMETPAYIPPPVETPVEVQDIDTMNGKLTEDEVTMILKQTLIPEHYRDQHVITFIAAYMRCRDTRQASTDAGIHASSGLALRNRPDVHEAITRLTTKSVNKYGFDASEVVERVKEIAAMDPIEFERPDGSYKSSMHEIAPEVRRAIKKFKVKNLFVQDPNGMPKKIGEIIEVELWSKEKALELLGREKDLFKETKKVEHDITKNMKQVLLGSRQRAEERERNIIDVTPRAMLPEGKGDVE